VGGGEDEDEEEQEQEEQEEEKGGEGTMMVMWICLGSVMVMGMRAGGQAAGRHLGPGLEVNITMMGALR